MKPFIFNQSLLPTWQLSIDGEYIQNCQYESRYNKLMTIQFVQVIKQIYHVSNMNIPIAALKILLTVSEIE